jgi:hypothetical protein
MVDTMKTIYEEVKANAGVIVWKKPAPIYEIPLKSIIVALFGTTLTQEDYDILLRLRSSNIDADTTYTFRINDDKRCLVIQKVGKTHGEGRDCFIFEPGLGLNFIPGRDYKPKTQP